MTPSAVAHAVTVAVAYGVDVLVRAIVTSDPSTRNVPVSTGV